jgi:dolichol-phosphate mannosyltransferase
VTNDYPCDESSTMIVLPVLNERLNLEILLPEIILRYPKIKLGIIDDNSFDGTDQFIEGMKKSNRNIHYIKRPAKLGIGDAHLAGISLALELGCEYVITMDADLTHRAEDIALFLSADYDFDLLVGSRYLISSNMFGWSPFRRFLTQAGHLATLVAFNSRLDMSSGMRRYRSSTLPLDLMKRNCPPDYAFFFVSALVYIKLKSKVGQVPLILNPRSSGESKMSLLLIGKGLSFLFLFATRIKKVSIK